MYEELIEQLARGATVLTPNRRLAAAVRHAFDLAQSRGGRATWPAADVLPWSAWLSRVYRDAFFKGAATQLLATPQQERFLWWSAVAQSPEARGLLGVSTTAEAASQAWQLAHAWRLFPALKRMPLAEEGEAFLRWSGAYEHASARQRLLDHARLPDTLQDLARSEKIALARRMRLFGFDELDPQQRELLDALRHMGLDVATCAVPPPRGTAVVVQEPGVEAEMRAAARWSRSRLTANPAARIGVVVPELTRLRSSLLRIFDEVLVPAAAVQPGQELQRPWNVSLGTALPDWPLIHSAVLILQLAGGELPLERASVLLRSPYIQGALSESDARALLDVRLRRLGDPHLTLQSLEFHAAHEAHPHSCPQLVQGLARLRARVGAVAMQRHPVSFWGPALQALLGAMQWPGERVLDSHEYQAFAAWKELLAELAQLDVISGPMRIQEAVELVRRLAGERMFQPESPPVPIQILGPLEAAQLEFDHLWVLGLTDETWPRMPHPNPLLPIELQRRRGVARCSADWELGFARRMQAGWEAAAAEVVLSWHSAADDRVLSASPLLGGLPGAVAEQLGKASSGDWRAEMHRAARLAETVDWIAVPLARDVNVSGGAKVLQDQAACPFRAFVAHRLHARALEHPQEGLSPRDRGIVLHAALAILWTQLASSQLLHDADPGWLQELLQRSVAGALHRLHPRRSSPLQIRFLELERVRLTELLEAWLDIERSRAPFEVVAREEDRVVSIGGLELRLRLDRVDRLPSSGGEMLIDYKSGPSSVSDWFGDRPDEPQLPLYAVTRQSPPDALAFARVARGESAFLGLAAGIDAAPGVQRFAPGRWDVSGDWSELIESWRTILERIADSFRSGRAVVEPKKGAMTCSRCDYALVCRVSELRDRGAPVPNGSDGDD